jgi:hypothetical protein
MYPRFPLLTAIVASAALAPSATQQVPAPWQDPSPHRLQMLKADQDVQLEVLDWGGSGRPIVLLAGLGHTAHIYNDFAPHRDRIRG